MRLSEIYNYIDVLNINDSKLLYVDQLTVKNINKFKELIANIEHYNLDFYKNEIDKFKNSELYGTSQNLLTFSSASKQSEIYIMAQYICNSLESLKLVLKKIVPTATETDFLIKFPKPDDFKVLLKDMSDIEKHISMIVNDESINSTMEIHNWEYGSYWINLTLGSIVVVQLMGAITWSAAYISTQINKQKEQELYLRQMNAQTEMIENIKNTHKVYLEQLIDNEIKHISKEHFKEEDNQRDKKIKNTIKLFSEIIQRGGEFQPSLISPQEIKDSYPDFGALEYIESKVLQITQTPESKQN